MIDINTQIEALDEQYRELRKNTEHDDLSGAKNDEIKRRVDRLCTRVIAASERLLPKESAYARQAEDAIRRHPRSGQITNPGGVVLRLFEILHAYSEDVEAGFLQELEASISTGVFADFLGMADHVLSEIHRTPAAVIAGFTLEEHLRKMCKARSISTNGRGGKPKTAEALNTDLAKAGTYSGKSEGKDVTAWIGRRNDAAHGQHDEYTDAQVNLMIEGIRAFLSRHPA
jgi:hypothetical protein